MNGRHVLVTGASSGIGRATAELLAWRGARVTLVARRADALKEAVASIEATGGAAGYVVADLADRAQLLAALERSKQRHGPIDGLFANAGIGGPAQPLEWSEYRDWDEVIVTNLTSMFWALKMVVPDMIRRGAGAVVMTGSLASVRGVSGHAAYVAAKHGVVGLMRAVAAEAAPSGVRLNCILPGIIDTPLLAGQMTALERAGVVTAMAQHVPQRRLGTAIETAEVVTFLLSDAASHVTEQAIAVDGGMLGTLSFSESLSGDFMRDYRVFAASGGWMPGEGKQGRCR